VLDRMPGSGAAVFRQIWEAGDAIPFWAASRFRGAHLYLAADSNEETDLAGGAIRTFGSVIEEDRIWFRFR
jgi:hypothetical protein